MRITKGLDVPITGKPEQKVAETLTTKKVALLGPDYVGMKPTMHVKVGDQVKKGQKLFTCKKVEGVNYCAPASGTITAINRGEKRSFQSVVIELSGDQSSVAFESYKQKAPKEYSFEEARDLLNESGMWSAIRTRPFSKAPALDSKPAAIFVTLTDTNPLTADPAIMIDEYSDQLKAGIELLARLTKGATYVCKSANIKLNTPDVSDIFVENIEGVHPAGNVGTHINKLFPVSANKVVWHVGYQDVIAIGSLVTTGKLFVERVISLAGPGVSKPVLYKTQVGACLCELTEGKLTEGENRVISGSILNGTRSVDPLCYLGRFHNQVSVLKEGRERELLGWQAPGLNKFSVTSVFLSKLIPSKLFSFTTSTNGSPRAMVPVGVFEKVMPMDILPTQLLRALVTKDTDYAQRLGCLELDEEDLALCTFVSPGKVDFGPILRENLTIIEKEG